MRKGNWNNKEVCFCFDIFDLSLAFFFWVGIERFHCALFCNSPITDQRTRLRSSMACY